MMTSTDRRDVGANQYCGLLVDGTLSAISMTVLKMCEGSRRSDRVGLVLAMVVKRHVHKGVIRQPEDDVADGVWLGSGKLFKDPLDPLLVLIRRFR